MNSYSTSACFTENAGWPFGKLLACFCGSGRLCTASAISSWDMIPIDSSSCKNFPEASLAPEISETLSLLQMQHQNWYHQQDHSFLLAQKNQNQENLGSMLFYLLLTTSTWRISYMISDPISYIYIYYFIYKETYEFMYDFWVQNYLRKKSHAPPPYEIIYEIVNFIYDFIKKRMN